MIDFRKELGRFTVNLQVGKKYLQLYVDLWTIETTDCDNLFCFSIVNPFWFIGEGRRVFTKQDKIRCG